MGERSQICAELLHMINMKGIHIMGKTTFREMIVEVDWRLCRLFVGRFFERDFNQKRGHSSKDHQSIF